MDEVKIPILRGVCVCVCGGGGGEGWGGSQPILRFLLCKSYKKEILLIPNSINNTLTKKEKFKV